MLGFELFWEVDELHHDDPDKTCYRESEISAQEGGVKEIFSPGCQVGSNDGTQDSTSQYPGDCLIPLAGNGQLSGCESIELTIGAVVARNKGAQH